jgi:hypothetical protein
MEYKWASESKGSRTNTGNTETISWEFFLGLTSRFMHLISLSVSDSLFRACKQRERHGRTAGRFLRDRDFPPPTTFLGRPGIVRVDADQVGAIGRTGALKGSL